MKRMKFYYVLRVLLSALGGVAVGGFVLWADAYAVEVFDVLLIATGVLTVAFDLPALAFSLRAVLKKKKREWVGLVLSAASIGLGICFALIPRTYAVLPLLLFFYVLPIPLGRIRAAEKRGKQARLELPKIAFGALLWIVTTTKSEDVMFWLLGGGLLVGSVLYLALQLWRMPKVCKPYTEKFDQ